jgi:AraC-like DNA-binding protein
MTISALSRHLSIHEYRLRQLINGELGYRNFNDFLNHYRINEVAERLRDPEHEDTTVLTLALDSGFHSLSSFNRAFKNTHGMTPTEYRNRCRYQSAQALS